MIRRFADIQNLLSVQIVVLSSRKSRHSVFSFLHNRRRHRAGLSRYPTDPMGGNLKNLQESKVSFVAEYRVEREESTECTVGGYVRIEAQISSRRESGERASDRSLHEERKRCPASGAFYFLLFSCQFPSFLHKL